MFRESTAGARDRAEPLKSAAAPGGSVSRLNSDPGVCSQLLCDCVVFVAKDNNLKKIINVTEDRSCVLNLFTFCRSYTEVVKM